MESNLKSADTYISKEEVLKSLAMEFKIMRMSPEERYCVCDMGYLNDTIKGYLLLAMRYAGIDKDTASIVVSQMSYVFDDFGATDAEKVYEKWLENR